MAFRQRSAQRGSRRCSEMEVEIGRGGGTEDDKAKARRKPGHEKFTVLNMSIANTEEFAWRRLPVLEEKEVLPPSWDLTDGLDPQLRQLLTQDGFRFF
jgi:hypothetical protein